MESLITRKKEWKLCVGEGASLFLTSSGVLFGNGVSTYFELGRKGTFGKLRKIEVMENGRSVAIKDCSLSAYTVFVLTRTGKLYTQGYNCHSDCGLGSRFQPRGPVKHLTLVRFFEKREFRDFEIEQIYSWWTSFVIIRDKKTHEQRIFCCGYTGYDGTGMGSGADIKDWREIPFFSKNKIKIVKIAVEHHTLFLSSKGDVYVVGKNSCGECGLGHTARVTKFTKLKYGFLNGKVRDIACKIRYSSSSFFVTTNGDVYSCGSNSHGQLGLGKGTNISTPNVVKPRLITFFKERAIRIVKVCCGYEHVMFIDINGVVYGCGANDYGRISGKLPIAKEPKKIYVPRKLDFEYPIVSMDLGTKCSILVDRRGSVFYVGSFTHFATALGHVRKEVVKIHTKINDGIYRMKDFRFRKMSNEMDSFFSNLLAQRTNFVDTTVVTKYG